MTHKSRWFFGIVGVIVLGMVCFYSYQADSASRAFRVSAAVIPESQPDLTPDQLAKAAIEKRQAFAETTEHVYLSLGRDVHMAARGPEADTLYMKYVLLGRPDAYQFSTDHELMGNLKNLGFRKAILTDGYETTYTIQIAAK
jgi:hypothetical protein